MAWGRLHLGCACREPPAPAGRAGGRAATSLRRGGRCDRPSDDVCRSETCGVRDQRLGWHWGPAPTWACCPLERPRTRCGCPVGRTRPLQHCAAEMHTVQAHMHPARPPPACCCARGTQTRRAAMPPGHHSPFNAQLRRLARETECEHGSHGSQWPPSCRLPPSMGASDQISSQGSLCWVSSGQCTHTRCVQLWLGTGCSTQAHFHVRARRRRCRYLTECRQHPCSVAV